MERNFSCRFPPFLKESGLMSAFRLLPILLLLSVFAIPSAVPADELSEEPFFQKLAGRWVGDGDVSGSEGEIIEIHEEWEGKVNEDGTFTMEGVRDSPQDEQREFRWTFLFNVATEGYEAEYWHTGMEQEIRLETVLAEESATCKASLGGDGAEARVTYLLEDGKLVGKVRITDAQGQVTLSADVVHERAGAE